jgi:arylsulfatase A-like enzyme
MFSGPGIARGKYADGFAYLFDIFPTLCELTGVEAPSTLEGKSQAAVIRGRTKSVRDTIFLAYRGIQRGVRQGRWKLLRYPEVGRTQLFDLERDPDEVQDLASDPRHKERVASLMTAMAAEQKRYGDTLALTSPTPRDGTVTEAFFLKA